MYISYSTHNSLSVEIKLYKFATEVLNKSIIIYTKINLLPIYRFLKLLLQIISILILGILCITIGYPFLVYSFKKSAKTISTLRSKLDSISTAELENINKLFINLEKNTKIPKENINLSIEKTPIILKPIVLSLNENFKQYIELRKEINNRINEDLNLFSQSLDVKYPLGMENL